MIVIHRLLKNHVTEKTGCRAYTLYSDAAIQQLGLEGICSLMTPHSEEYEHLGEVKTWIQNMHPVWEKKKELTRVQILPEKILYKVATDIRSSPEIIWDYLIQPDHLNVLLAGTRTEVANRQNDQVAVGTTFRCYHGDSFIPLTILEWQPFERIITQAIVPIPIKGTTMMNEFILEPTPQGTRFIQVFTKAEGPFLGRLMADMMFKALAKDAQRDIDNFGKHIEENLNRHPGGLPAPAQISAEMISAAALASLSNP